MNLHGKGRGQIQCHAQESLLVMFKPAAVISHESHQHTVYTQWSHETKHVYARLQLDIDNLTDFVQCYII